MDFEESRKLAEEWLSVCAEWEMAGQEGDANVKLIYKAHLKALERIEELEKVIDDAKELFFKEKHRREELEALLREALEWSDNWENPICDELLEKIRKALP